MEQIDFFEKSIFVKKEIQKVYNIKLNKYFEILAGIFEFNENLSEILYTGSLSRREPSISVDGSTLWSDIDLMILKTSYDNNIWDEKIKQILDSIFPQFKNSVMLFPLKEKRVFKSFIGYDLRKSLKTPVYRHGETLKIKFESVKREDYFEIIIHQLGNYILNPAYLKQCGEILLNKNIVYSELKLILECLRTQFIGEDDISYNLVYRKKTELKYILNKEYIDKLIYQRENFTPEYKIEVDIKEILLKSIIRPMNIKVKNIEDVKECRNALLEYLRNQNLNNISLMNIYQYTLLNFYFFISDSEMNKEWERNLSEYILNHSIKFHSVKEEYSQEEIIKIIQKREYKRMVNILRLMREDYIGLLCIKNTGDISFLDIKKKSVCDNLK